MREKQEYETKAMHVSHSLVDGFRINFLVQKKINRTLNVLNKDGVKILTTWPKRTPCSFDQGYEISIDIFTRWGVNLIVALCCIYAMFNKVVNRFWFDCHHLIL
jgi:hypothetical protein